MLANQIQRIGSYWPTMEYNCAEYVKRCRECQEFATFTGFRPIACLLSPRYAGYRQYGRQQSVPHLRERGKCLLPPREDQRKQANHLRSWMSLVGSPKADWQRYRSETDPRSRYRVLVWKGPSLSRVNYTALFNWVAESKQNSGGFEACFQLLVDFI